MTTERTLQYNTRAGEIEAFKKKTAEPEAMQQIFRHVANGGSVLDLFELWGVAYSDMLEWIIADDARRNLYNSAMQTQSEYVKREVLDTLRKIAMFDMRSLYDKNGALLHPKEWPKEASFAVAGMEVEELFEWTGEKGDKQRELVGYAKKLKIRDNLKAFEMIGRNLALFIERHEHTHKHTLEALVMASIGSEPEKIPGTPEKSDRSIKTHTGFLVSPSGESDPTLEPQLSANPDKISGENSEAPETKSEKNFPENFEKTGNENSEKISEKIPENGEDII